MNLAERLVDKLAQISDVNFDTECYMMPVTATRLAVNFNSGHGHCDGSQELKEVNGHETITPVTPPESYNKYTHDHINIKKDGWVRLGRNFTGLFTIAVSQGPYTYISRIKSYNCDRENAIRVISVLYDAGYIPEYQYNP